MPTTLAPFFYKIPEMRLVRSQFRLELAHVCGLAIVAGFAGRGRVFPGSLTALANRVYVIKSSSAFCYFYTTVLAGVGVSQEDVSLA